jgi:hypothetical protein
VVVVSGGDVVSGSGSSGGGGRGFSGRNGLVPEYPLCQNIPCARISLKYSLLAAYFVLEYPRLPDFLVLEYPDCLPNLYWPDDRLHTLY